MMIKDLKSQKKTQDASRTETPPSPLLPSPPPDVSRVKLMRFQDPLMGPRRVPILGQEERDKLPISTTSVFSVDLQQRGVTLSDGTGPPLEVGDTLAYLLL